jgi:Na+-driven multidrug efflux pump
MQRFGVVGIALATSLMYLISCCFLMLVSLRLLKRKTSERIVPAMAEHDE